MGEKINDFLFWLKTMYSMKAIWNGETIAESANTREIEGNQYFPPESVKREFLKESNTHTICPWKGTASYFNLEVNGKINNDAAWYYPDPKTAALEIKDFIAFWKGVEIMNH